MGINLNVDIASWKAGFMKSTQNIEKATDYTVRSTAQHLYKKIVSYTPVGDPSLWKYPAHKDYTPGTLKAAWKLTEEDNEIRISNDTPYAVRVEFGWSYLQAPQGMMRRATMEYPILFGRTWQEYKI